MQRTRWSGLLLGAATLCLSGCAWWVDNEVPASATVAPAPPAPVAPAAAVSAALPPPPPAPMAVAPTLLGPIQPNDPAFLRANLLVFGLRPLAQTPAGGFTRRYRFLWWRPSQAPALFEVDAGPAGGTYTAKYWGGKGAWVTQSARALSAAQIASYDSIVATNDLAELRWYDGRDDGRGSKWFVELARGDAYHAIFRWSPLSGGVRAFGEAMIDPAIDSPFMPIY